MREGERKFDLAQQWLFSPLSLCSALPICILLPAAGQCEIIRKSLILASVLSSVLPRFLRVSHSFSCGNFLVRTNIRASEAHLSPFPSSPCAHFCPLLAQQWFFSPLSLCSALPICILLPAAGQCEIIRKSLILASVLSSVLPRFLRVSHSFSCGNFLVRTNIRASEAHLSPFPSSPCAHFLSVARATMVLFVPLALL